MAPGVIIDTPIADPVTKSDHLSLKQSFPDHADSEDYARSLDAADSLRHFRDKFIIPTKASLKAKCLQSAKASNGKDSSTPEKEATYFCGNSLGLQPKRTSQYVQAHLDTWASIGVAGHFRQMEQSPLKPWQETAEFAADQSCRLVGALPGEVAVANTLTVNLHLLMASFYRPTAKRNKILLEWKAFPSDHVSMDEVAASLMSSPAVEKDRKH